MKRSCAYLIGVLSLLLTSTVSAQVIVGNSVIREISNTFASLFDGLRRGDVKTITLYLSAQEYARYKVLFEQNWDYPNFLRNFYRGAVLRVGQIDCVLSAKNEVIGEFIVDFPGAETMVKRMRLERDGSGRWKIKKILAGKYDQGEPSGEGHR